jgi:hypothetical protein
LAKPKEGTMKARWITPIGAALAALSLAAAAADSQASKDGQAQQADDMQRMLLEKCESAPPQERQACIDKAQQEASRAQSEERQKDASSEAHPPAVAEAQPSAPDAGSMSNMREASATRPAR